MATIKKISLNGVPYDLGGGLTEDVKQASLQIAEKVAYIDEHGQDYYDELYTAFYDNMWNVTNTLSNAVNSNSATKTLKDGTYTAIISAATGYTLEGATVSVTMNGANITSSVYNNGMINIPSVTGNVVITVVAVALTVVSISAVYTQSGTVYDTDSLDSLKADLVVTATFNDDSTAVVPSEDYTLTGTLTEGTSIITVTMGSLIATFNVTVTANPLPEGYTLYDYVTANGTQYIQTNITEAQVANWGYECKESANGVAQGNGHILSSTNFYFPFLSRGTNATDLWMVHKRYGNETHTVVSGDYRYVADTPYTIKAYQNGTDYVYRYGTSDDDEYVYTLTKGTTGLNSSNKMAFFTYGGSVTQTKYRFYGNFYYAKLTDANGNLVHYYIPCKNASNVVGLYDAVTGTFLSPTAGTLTGKAR